MLVFACISPHPPIILPNIGSPEDRERVKTTITALESLAARVTEAKPEIIIISSPHPDWGIEVPLYFLGARVQGLGIRGETSWKIENYQQADLFKLAASPYTLSPLLTTLDSPKQHFEWGKKIIRQLPEKRRVCWIASGDMSHRLKVDGPYGLHPSGPKFDKKFIELLKKKDIQGILNLDPQFVEEAGECGLRSFCVLLGALEEEKLKWKPEILSYEGPFGVGYLVVNFKLTTVY
jgi:aromatic ring-opening dioxygenase LigB subunit